MKKFLFSLFIVSFLGAGCASPGFGPTGGIFTDTKIGIHATSTAGDREGRACAQSYLGLVGIGDASVGAAAAAGGINSITHIDLEIFSLLVYAELCTVVRGN